MKKMTRILSILSLMLTTTVLPINAQTTNDKNKAIIETSDGQQQMNTDEISVIRFNGDKITFVQPWGESVFNRTLRSLSFLRPNPSTLRLTANTTIDDEGGARRSQSIDGDGNLRTTWSSDDVVYVYTDENATECIGTLAPNCNRKNASSATLSGNINADLTDGQTLYFSTQNRATFDLSSQNDNIESLFYCTATGNVTIDGGNASVSDLVFAHPLSIVKFTLKDKSNNTLSATQLDVQVAGNTYTVNSASPTSVFYAAIPGFADQDITLLARTSKGNYVYAKSDVTFENGHYYTISVKTAPAIIDLSAVTANTIVTNGFKITGTLAGNYQISIADGATVTLDNANISCLETVYGAGATYAGLTCLGDATIILADGTTNTIVGGGNIMKISETENYYFGFEPGIYIPGGKTLTIKGETAGTGTLTAKCAYADIDAEHPYHPFTSGIGDRTDLAGLSSSQGTSCGNINIEGGTVIAYGGEQAAGIGSKPYGGCGNITISGGNISAYGGRSGAGIGCGAAGTCGNITISGGNITARGGRYAAAIGSGEGENEGSTCGDITITGGTVTATGGYSAATIGSGKTNNTYVSKCGDITITNTVNNVTVTKADDSPYNIGTGTNGTCGTVTIGGEVGAISKEIYIYPTITVNLAELTDNYEVRHGSILTGTLAGNHKVTIPDGAIVTLDNATINGTNDNSYDWAGLTCLGNATIILKDGSASTVKGFHENYPGIYVPVGKTLTIQGETEGTGSLTASSNGKAAGIGGGYDLSCGNISIDKVIVNATGGDYAAGIGGGKNAECGKIDIKYSTTSLTVTKGTDAPYTIGAGKDGISGKVTIKGYKWNIKTSPYTYPSNIVRLDEIASNYSIRDGDILTGTLQEGIQLFLLGNAKVTLDNVTIRRGDNNWKYANYHGLTCGGGNTIILKDGSTNIVEGLDEDYAGIFIPANKTLTIQGTGSLTATGKGKAAGIGGGLAASGKVMDDCGNICIEGGTINATGGEYAAAIGGVQNKNCGDITIKNTVTSVTATKGANAPYSIGKGAGSGTCGTVTIGDAVGAISESPYTYQP